jgi:hypothetical protein
MEPPVSEAAQPFWDATKKGELVLQWCKHCDKVIHYPREACPHCLGTSLEFRPSSGVGEVYAASVMHRAGNPSFADQVPYVVGLVELEGGARLMTNIVGCEPSSVKVGMQVKVKWEPLSDGRQLPLFEPV